MEGCHRSTIFLKQNQAYKGDQIALRAKVEFLLRVIKHQFSHKKYTALILAAYCTFYAIIKSSMNLGGVSVPTL